MFLGSNMFFYQIFFVTKQKDKIIAIGEFMEK